MSPVGRFGPACVCGCGRPAREPGGYATACFKALSPAKRKVESDCDPPDDTPGPLTSAAKHALFEAYYAAREAKAGEKP